MSDRQGFEKLAENVILSERCTGCGACYAACPFEQVLDYAERGPKIVGECKKCGICNRSCPRYLFDASELEEFVFHKRRMPADLFGIHLSSNVARATDAQVRSVGQDGGVASALLLNAFNSGLIDGAVISSTNPTQPWFPVPVLTRNREDVARTAGTRYSYSPGIMVLRGISGEQLKQLAFVGTPCQCLALRRMQKIFLKKVVGSISVIIGLFCSESFSYSGLMLEKIQKGMGISPSEIEKMNIKGRMQITLRSGKVAEIPLKEIRPYAEPFCRFCGDFSSEFADISLGGVGLDGQTFTVVRTERGKKFLDSAVESGRIELRPAEEFKTAYDLLVRLSVNKRNRARGTI